MKVAVIDSGFNGALGLGGTIHTQCSQFPITNSGPNHGAQVAAIVRQIAPEATLILADIGTNFQAPWTVLQNTVNCINTTFGGADVCSSSYGLGDYQSAGDGSSLLNNAINSASSTALWSSPSGNSGRRHCGRPWYPSASQSDWMDMGNGSSTKDVFIPVNSTLTVKARWADGWGANNGQPNPIYDYDMWIWFPDWQTSYGSVRPQNGGAEQRPLEELVMQNHFCANVSYAGFLGCFYHVGIHKRHNGAIGQHVDIVYERTLGSDDDDFWAGGSQSQGALQDPADNRGAAHISVGAVRLYPSDQLKPYSSGGQRSIRRRLPTMATGAGPSPNSSRRQISRRSWEGSRLVELRLPNPTSLARRRS